VARSYEHSNEPSGSIKGEEISHNGIRFETWFIHMKFMMDKAEKKITFHILNIVCCIFQNTV
jgi:hypothetical protein